MTLISAVLGANGVATKAQGVLADTATQPGDLAIVATSGAYSDLFGLPTLANVATTGAYGDLSGLPSLGTIATQNANAVTFTGSIQEEVFALTGATPALDPANGTIQTWILTVNSTPADGLAAGEAITLMIDDGAGRTITWPTITWVNNGGAAPTLATTGYTVIALWKVSTTLYGALVGDGS